MIPHSRQTIHMGLGFIISPKPSINTQTRLKFQLALNEQGIEFSKIAFTEDEIVINREAPSRLNLRVGTIAPPTAPLGQLLIIAPQAGADCEYFKKEARAVIGAFESTWPATARQIINCDAIFRALFETSREHAFQELWEDRLGQPPEALKVLMRPVIGGGLRFVMPPQMEIDRPVEIQLKVESFLHDTKKIFVEAQFKWPQALPPGEPLDPEERLNQINDFLDNEAVDFIMGETDD